jgi:hypothetical protein
VGEEAGGEKEDCPAHPRARQKARKDLERGYHRHRH